MHVFVQDFMHGSIVIASFNDLSNIFYIKIKILFTHLLSEILRIHLFLYCIFKQTNVYVFIGDKTNYTKRVKAIQKDQ